MFGLVLSGGGAKGSYEVGVIRALEKLKISPDIVTGTSIGSVNAALTIQGGYKLLYKFWTSTDVNDLFDIDNINELAKSDMKKAKRVVAREALKNGGLDTSNFYNKVKKALNEKKIRKSNKTLGIVSFNVSDMKGSEKYLEDIEYGDLAKYILASSSCFPLLKGTMIDNDFYIDGAYSDNMPFTMALKKGATDIVIVDLKAIGIKKIIKDKYNGKKINVKYIAPNRDLGDMIVFTKKDILSNMNLGYIDTMRAFNKCYGKDLVIDDKAYDYILSKINETLVTYLPSDLSSLKKEIEKDNNDFVMDFLDVLYDSIKNDTKFLKYKNKIITKFKLKKLLYFTYIFGKKDSKIDLDFNDIKSIDDAKGIIEDIYGNRKNIKTIIVKNILNLLDIVNDKKIEEKIHDEKMTELKFYSMFFKKEFKLALLIKLFALK